METAAKAKAKELMDAMYAWNQAESQKVAAKECALIAVDEILSSYNMTNVEYEDGYFEKFWQAVKAEIILNK